MTGSPGVPGIRVRSPWYLGGLLLGAFAAYGTTLTSAFMGDDYESTLAVIEPGPGLRWLTEPGAGGHLRPVLWVVVWLNHAVFGLNPFGWHVVNVVLHAGTSWLVAVLAASLLGQTGDGDGDGAGLAARVAPPLAGVLFLVSPVHAEPVSWIAARADLILAPVCIVAVLAWIRWRALEAEGQRWGRWLWASLGAFGVALLTKESAIAFPAVLLAYELWFPRSGRRRLDSLWASGPALALFVGLLGVHLLRYARVRVGFFGGEGEVLAAQGPLVMVRGVIETTVRSVLPSMSRGWWTVVAGLLVAGAVVLLLARRRARLRGQPLRWTAQVGFCVTAVVITALPTARLGVSLFTPGGGRFAYLPSVFSTIVVALVLAELISWSKRAGNVVIPVVVATAIGLLLVANQPYVRAGRVSARIEVSQAQWPVDQPVVLLVAPDTIDGAWVGRNRSPYDLALIHGWTVVDGYREVSSFQMAGEGDTVSASAGTCSWCIRFDLEDPDARFAYPEPLEVPTPVTDPWPHVTSISDRSIEIELEPGTDPSVLWYYSGGGFVPLDVPLG